MGTRFIPLVLLCIALSAFAQKNPPKDLEPIPEPPPVRAESDPALEPQVTIRKEGEDVIQEIRVSGEIVMVRVIPKVGVPYYLVRDRGDGKWVRQENLDSGLRIPMWVLFTF